MYDECLRSDHHASGIDKPIEKELCDRLNPHYTSCASTRISYSIRITYSTIMISAVRHLF